MQGQRDSMISVRDAIERAAALVAIVASDRSLHAQLEAVVARTTEILKTGGTLFACGNGGSASQATHVTGELVGSFLDRQRPPLRAIPLGFDPSSLTAIANDYNYQIIFSRQLQALGKRGDILWAFSTSGNSANVLEAMKTAKARQLQQFFSRIVMAARRVVWPTMPCIPQSHLLRGSRNFTCFTLTFSANSLNWNVVRKIKEPFAKPCI